MELKLIVDDGVDWADNGLIGDGVGSWLLSRWSWWWSCWSWQNWCSLHIE